MLSCLGPNYLHGMMYAVIKRGGGLCPSCKIQRGGLCPSCKIQRGDYVLVVKFMGGDFVHVYKNEQGVLSRGDFVLHSEIRRC